MKDGSRGAGISAISQIAQHAMCCILYNFEKFHTLFVAEANAAMATSIALRPDTAAPTICA